MIFLALSPCGIETSEARSWGGFAKRRRVRGSLRTRKILSREETPHPVRTSHSRCKASASLKNGGRRPPMTTFSHRGRREKRRLALFCSLPPPQSHQRSMLNRHRRLTCPLPFPLSFP